MSYAIFLRFYYDFEMLFLIMYFSLIFLFLYPCFFVYHTLNEPQNSDISQNYYPRSSLMWDFVCKADFVVNKSEALFFSQSGKCNHSCDFLSPSWCLSCSLLSMPFSVLLYTSPELQLLGFLMTSVKIPPICAFPSSPLPLLQLQLLRQLTLSALLPSICPLPYFPDHFLLLS